ncbi:hypothetical protein AWENTII_007592 [Aspergillus wentii]
MTMFMLILIVIGMHRPKFSTSSVIIIIFTACIWGLDRLIRLAKIFWNFPGNHATVTALPNGGIRVRLTRRLAATPGSHAFLWLPAIRLFEMHPFTMVSVDPAEFVIRAHDGFSGELYRHAQNHNGNGATLRCSVDGGYGQILDFGAFERVVLVAGGSGMSFTCAVAAELIRKSAASRAKKIDFIWTVREKQTLSWYQEELRQLQDNSLVNLIIHVTHSSIPSTEQLPQATSSLEKEVLATAELEAESDPVPRDTEAGPLEKTTIIDYPLTMHPGRPDIYSLISSATFGTDTKDRIAVGVCGPSGLVDSTRQAVSRAMADGALVTLYAEVSLCQMHLSKQDS